MGKEVVNTIESFEYVKAITDRFYSSLSTPQEVFSLLYQFLEKNSIKLRGNDGANPSMTVSVPKSITGIVVGIRYVKLSGKYTEDHFLFRPGHNLYKCKGKELERICSEYKGAHILQPQ